MGFFDQNKALIITVLLISIMLLVMYNVTLSSSNRELTGTMIDLKEIELEEPVEQEEQTSEEPAERIPQSEPTSVRTHQAFNQNQEEKQDNFESRLNEIFEKNSAKKMASEEEATTTTEGDFQLNQKKRDQVREQSDGENISDNISTQTGSIRNSSISFSLLGRRAVVIPNPVYTCHVSGRIVVNITVDAGGQITRTSINKSSSTSTNECLTEQAQEYAAKALFTELPGRNNQIGTITYNFKE